MQSLSTHRLPPVATGGSAFLFSVTAVWLNIYNDRRAASDHQSFQGHLRHGSTFCDNGRELQSLGGKAGKALVILAAALAVL